ncbi:MAG: hypothetical protein AUG13_05040 [Chloroflexi bacterium 13_1_20CM_2_59_7]|nr:MAG: hypothetical protein AUG13_05040 [Chloroflexi bacterium 13_1_20CM_2_59_7]
MVGSDTEGKVFSEETKTVLLSRHGAGIVSHYKLSAEQELILRRLDTNKETEVRVVGQIGVESDIYTYGVAFLDSTNNFWGISFPQPSDAEKRANVTLLECSSCKAREAVEHSDLEVDVYLVNEGIVRFCKHCGSSTLWKRSSEDTEEVPVAVEVAQAPVAVPAALSRRKHVRTKVSFKACVRSFAHGDDIVTCEDISRGGLRFRSRKPYTEKFKVEVAAPYSAGAQNIFVPAEVVHVLELKEQRMFRCGVAYLRNS